MASNNFYDNHTLFIKCDCASADQIRLAFREALTNYKIATGKSLDCRYRVNLVENREGKSFGIAFVFITNSAVYYMLLGKNPDGSDRIEYIDDPSWVTPSDGELTNDSGWSSISDPVYTPGMSWADVSDYEMEFEKKIEEERNRYVCPKMAIQLEPLMVLPPFKLTPQQIDEKRAKIITDNEGKTDFNSDLVEIPDLAYFGVDRAMATPVDPKFMHNILKCKEIPPWVTKEDVKMQFAPYATDSKTLQERFIKGRKVEETYPFVNINDDRVAFIIFDPSTHDAQFALHMMKKTLITKKTTECKARDNERCSSMQGMVNTVTLIFGHSFRTDRDLMADISQQPRPVQRRDNINPSRDNRRDPRTRTQETGDRKETRDKRGHRNNHRSNGNSESRDSQSRGNLCRAAANAIPQRQVAKVFSGNPYDILDGLE